MLAVWLLPVVLCAQDAAEGKPSLVILEGLDGPLRVLTKRMEMLGIPADCLPHDQLFREKRLFLYDALVVPAVGTLSKAHYEDVKIFVAKGGVFIPFADGGTAMDMDGNLRVTLPPDVIVSSKGGVFYQLTGGVRHGGSYRLHEFSVLLANPITEGFTVNERLQADVIGLSVLWPAEGTIVCCGNALVMRNKETAQTKEGSVIQVRKVGKGASIWITARLYEGAEPCTDRLLTNVFSRKTFDWCRRLP